MKTDLKTLKDTTCISFDAFRKSREEANTIIDMYHNRQYSSAELKLFATRKQPPETFNVIKLFGRLIVGWYSTVVNTVKISPQQETDLVTALLLHDVVQYTLKENLFETEGDKIKLDGVLTGLMCAYLNVIDSGEKDENGKIIFKIEISHVPAKEILIDPMSYKEDYSDARYIHRFKWVSKEYLHSVLRTKYGKTKINNIIDKLEAYANGLNESDSEWSEFFPDQFQGYIERYDSYLLIHSIIIDDNNRSWSILWCGDVEIDRKEITYLNIKIPYVLQKVHVSDKAEYYGLFREIVESQKAINQAVSKIQYLVNTHKIILQKGAVDNIDDFIEDFNRVNSAAIVKDLSKVQIVDVKREVAEQYVLIEKAYERVQKILGINDSFLGMAYASDSGRKVKLQQNATILSLRYLTTKIEQFYRSLGYGITSLIQQYYTAHQVLKITAIDTGERWIEINRPIQIPTGQTLQDGSLEMYTPYEEVLDPASGEPQVDSEKNIIVAPIPTKDTEIAFSRVDIDIDSIAFDDQQEQAQALLDTVTQGPLGQALMQTNPAAYYKAVALSFRNTNTKNSLYLAELFENEAMKIEQAQQLAQMNPEAEAINQQQRALESRPQQPQRVNAPLSQRQQESKLM